MIRKFIPSICIDFIKSFRSKIFNGVSFTYKSNLKNVWVNNSWLQISRDKLEEIKNEKVCNFGGGHLMIPTLIINSFKNCKVLDFGGGTGFVYFKIFKNLINDVEWNIVDYKELLDIGEEYALQYQGLYSINFYRKIPKKDYDVLYINTTLQYIYNYREILRELLKGNPEYIIFNRLIAGDIPTHFSTQNIHGDKTKVMFLNVSELISFLEILNYELTFKGDCIEESYKGCYEDNIEEKFRINNSMNLVFRRKTGGEK